MNEILILNCSLLDQKQGKSPILAFAHKKIHDVFTAVELLLSRGIPMPAHTVIAQGGLFSGMYAYRDWIPGFLKAFPFRILSIWFARWIGRRMENLFRNAGCNPVYRRFRDVPSRKVYESHLFAGKAISGLTYDEFLEYTRVETHRSIETVRRGIKEENKSLIIFPEGKYQHSGSVAKLNGFLMNIATDSGHPIAAVSMSYDELCPDDRGRIDAVLNVTWIEPADSRASLTRKTAAALQEGTAIVASQILAWLLLCEGGSASHPSATTGVTRDELYRHFLHMAQCVREGSLPFDPRLASPEFLQDRFDRFWKYNGEFLSETGGKFYLNRSRLARYSRSERTANDLEWNRNNIIHADQVFHEYLAKLSGAQG